MSVINTMLQDLEQRRVEMDRSGAYRHVRALPMARQGRHLKTALLAGAGVALAAAAIYFVAELWRRQAQVSASTAAALVAPAKNGQVNGQASAPSPFLFLSVSRELVERETSQPVEVRAKASTPSQAGAQAPALVRMRAVSPATKIDPAASSEIPRNPAPEPAQTAQIGAAAQMRASQSAIERPLGLANLPSLPLHEIKQVSPQQRAESEYRRGSDLLTQGRQPQAIDAFAQALALDVAHDPARQALVAAFLRNKNPAEAERLLQERQALQPRSAVFAMMLARLQAERGDNEQALDTLRAGQPVAGSNPAYYATTAALMARLGQHAEAITQYQNALRIAPQSGVWWMGLGLSFQAQGSLAEAQEALRRARGSDNLPVELAAFVDQRLRQLQ